MQRGIGVFFLLVGAITVSSTIALATGEGEGERAVEGEGETKSVEAVYMDGNGQLKNVPKALPKVEVILPTDQATQEPAEKAVAATAERTTLRVVVSPFEPMVVQRPDGSFTGFDIDLMEAIVKEIKADVSYTRVAEFKELIPHVSEGKADIGLGGITITEERESKVDFSHHYFPSGLRIVAEGVVEKPSIIPYIAERLFTLEVLWVIVLLVIFIFVFGFILWFAERGDHEKDVIDDNFNPGYEDASWTVLAISTTIGFGDHYPTTRKGRLMTIPIFLVGTVVWGIVTGPINAAFVVRDIEVVKSSISGPRDLRGKKVGTVQGSTSVRPLQFYGATILAAQKIGDAYTLLEEGAVDAVVFDSPSILHFVNGRGKGKFVSVGKMFERQDYGFAFPVNWERREDVNRALLRLRRRGIYHEIYAKWFGSESN